MFWKACTAIMVIVFVEVDGIDVIEGGASRTVPRLDKIVSTIDRHASAINWKFAAREQ